MPTTKGKRSDFFFPCKEYKNFTEHHVQIAQKWTNENPRRFISVAGKQAIRLRWPTQTIFGKMNIPISFSTETWKQTCGINLSKANREHKHIRA